MGVDQTSLDRIRKATFPTARRGYDKREVERFLARLADWLETGSEAEPSSDAVRRELEKVGQRTGAILAQAEESAQQIRAEAETEAKQTRSAAEATRAEAHSLREKALAEAEESAQEVLAEANRRRQDTEALIEELAARRDEILADVQSLTEQLKGLVEQARPGRETAEPGAVDPLEDEEDGPVPVTSPDREETEQQQPTETFDVEAVSEAAEDRSRAES
jgi:DivIVA domain-containing protein